MFDLVDSQSGEPLIAGLSADDARTHVAFWADQGVEVKAVPAAEWGPEGDRKPSDPTPAEIAEAAAAIRREWRELRWQQQPFAVKARLDVGTPKRVAMPEAV